MENKKKQDNGQKRSDQVPDLKNKPQISTIKHNKSMSYKNRYIPKADIEMMREDQYENSMYRED